MDCLVHFDKSDLGEGYVSDVPDLFGEPGGLGKAALKSASVGANGDAFG